MFITGHISSALAETQQLRNRRAGHRDQAKPIKDFVYNQYRDGFTFLHEKLKISATSELLDEWANSWAGLRRKWKLPTDVHDIPLELLHTGALSKFLTAKARDLQGFTEPIKNVDQAVFYLRPCTDNLVRMSLSLFYVNYLPNFSIEVDRLGLHTFSGERAHVCTSCTLLGSWTPDPAQGRRFTCRENCTPYKAGLARLVTETLNKQGIFEELLEGWWERWTTQWNNYWKAYSMVCANRAVAEVIDARQQAMKAFTLAGLHTTKDYQFDERKETKGSLERWDRVVRRMRRYNEISEDLADHHVRQNIPDFLFEQEELQMRREQELAQKRAEAVKDMEDRARAAPKMTPAVNYYHVQQDITTVGAGAWTVT